MNSSDHALLVLIAVLTCFVLNSYLKSSEKFTTYSPTDSVYAPIGINGINNLENTIPLNKYANQVAYNLQNPFPSATTGSNSRTPWNPAVYRDVQEPDGQFVGIISPN
jgi:hypothetical protein